MLVVGSVGKAKDRGPVWSAVWVASALFPGSGRFGLEPVDKLIAGPQNGSCSGVFEVPGAVSSGAGV